MMDEKGVRIGGQLVACLAYADDLVILSRSDISLQEQLDTAVEVAEQHPSEVAFNIQRTEIASLQDGEHYRHLGVPTGFRCRQTPLETIAED